MKLEVLQSLYAVCKIPSAGRIPEWVFEQPEYDSKSSSEIERHIVSCSITDKECSLVLPQQRIPNDVVGIECEKSWRAFRVSGSLDFDMVGVIAGISTVLKSAAIPIFVVSTFDTDYILVPNQKFETAKSALESAKYQIV